MKPVDQIAREAGRRYYQPNRRPPEWINGLAAWKALPPERRLELRRKGLTSCARIVDAYRRGWKC